MKKELVILHGQENLDAIKAVQSKDVIRQRLAFMNNQIGEWHLGKSNRSFGVTKLITKGDIMYYACDGYMLYLSASGKLFTRSTNNAGFTYEPLNNHKLTLWHGTKLNMINNEVIETMLKEAGAEWALECKKDNTYGTLHNLYMHKGLFQRILKGRITNPEDLVRAWLKVDTRWRALKISHRAKTILTLMRRNMDLHELIEFLSLVSNVETTLDMILQGKRLGQYGRRGDDGKVLRDETGAWLKDCDFDWFLLDGEIRNDMRNELIILDKKINSLWSATRLHNMHTEMSRQLLDLEVEDMEIKEHGYQTPCPVLPGMELIDNNIRLYTEGRTMGHCIYSYLDQAQRRDLFHFHCKFGDKPFSLAVQYKSVHRSWDVQQMYGKYNGGCSNEQWNIVHRWLAEEAVQQWLTNEERLAKTKISDQIKNDFDNWL